MKYISNNEELNKAIKLAYQREIEPYQLADIYFKNKLYSAAASYYVIQINDIHNKKYNDDYMKSYCFGKVAECYYNQQIDHKFSNWQLKMIYDMCQEAIIYNHSNYKPYLICGKCLILMKEYKSAYFIYDDFINNLKNFDLDEQDLELFLDVIYEFFDLCEMYYIIKYDDTYNKIINFISKYSFFNFNAIDEIHKRYKRHKDSVTQLELDIMNGNITKYYKY